MNEVSETQLERLDGAPSELGATQDEMDLMPLKRMLDVEDNKQDKNLEVILGWAQSKGLNSRDAMQLELRRIEMKLGAAGIGENRVARLARYLILDGRANSALKEMQTYEK